MRLPTHSVVFRTVGAGLILLLLACLALMVDGLQDNLHPADVAVVLGSKVNPDGVPSLMLRARLDETVELYREGYFKVVLVSGGHGREGYDEPVVMRHYLEKAGLPAASITRTTTVSPLGIPRRIRCASFSSTISTTS